LRGYAMCFLVRNQSSLGILAVFAVVASAGGCSASNTEIHMAEGGVDSQGEDSPLFSVDGGRQDFPRGSGALDSGEINTFIDANTTEAQNPTDAADVSVDTDGTDSSIDAGHADTEQCGNGVCGSGETQENCCSDCGCGIGSVCNHTACIVLTGIAAGGFHSCLLLNDGTAACWGGNSYGELGNGSSTLFGVPVPAAVAGLTGAVSISAGATFTCAVLADGTVRCWGGNSTGQLGNGTKTSSALPVPVLDLMEVTSVSAGYGYACAVVSDGTARCWGDNASGQLGDQSTTQSSVPVEVKGLTGVVKIAAGFNSTCALLSDGAAKCWGDNSFGQLGVGTGTASLTPVQVLSVGSATGIFGFYSANPAFVSSDQDSTFCAVLSDGSAECWGSSALGATGAGTDGLTQARPIAVRGALGVLQIAGGQHFACATTSSGVSCWGYNASGQLGNGSSVNLSNLPVQVSNLGTAVAVAAGTYHACALLSDGSVQCWGDNTYDQLGNETMRSSAVPVSVF
jgi:alpha-tubulin suppressor-like RCC1 family protein